MPFEVEDRRCSKLSGHESLIERTGSIDLLYEFGRNDFSCLIMTCIVSKDLRMESPVLHDLRRKLYEVTCHCRSCHTLVCTLAKKSVKGVSELMEHSLHFIKGKK